VHLTIVLVIIREKANKNTFHHTLSLPCVVCDNGVWWVWWT
jgi:hypothetical protein